MRSLLHDMQDPHGRRSGFPQCNPAPSVEDLLSFTGRRDAGRMARGSVVLQAAHRERMPQDAPHEEARQEATRLEARQGHEEAANRQESATALACEPFDAATVPHP